jgi:glucokinase
MSPTGKILLGDLSNGSSIKLALAEPGCRPDAAQLYSCQDQEDVEGAIVSHLSEAGDISLVGAGFSTSGWEVDGRIDLVHFGFSLDKDYIRDLLGTSRVCVVNNFVAKALAIPVLEDDERERICGEDQPPGGVVAVIGPNSGLGGAVLAPAGSGRWVANHCEGGHADFAPRTALEIEILKLMMDKYGHVSRERAVSAHGLVELWACLATIEGDVCEPLTIDEILVQAYVGDDRARTAIRLQTEIYAGVASDFALMVGAKGGVYLGGTHLEALGTLFDPEVFTARFYDKGRVSSFVRDIPVYRLRTSDPEILGVGTLFDAH